MRSPSRIPSLIRFPRPFPGMDAESLAGDECLEEDEEELETSLEDPEQDSVGKTVPGGRSCGLLTRRGITLRVLLKDGLIEPGEGVLSIYYLSLISEGEEEDLGDEEEDEAKGMKAALADSMLAKKVDEKSRKLLAKSLSDSHNADHSKRLECQNRIPVRYCSLGSRDSVRNPHTLVEVTSFAALNKFQPFNVAISSNVLLLVDFHSHLSRSEVVGYLAGQWNINSQLLTVLRAFPCRSRLGDGELAAIVEEEQRPYDYGIPMEVEVTYIQDGFLTNDVLHEMRKRKRKEGRKRERERERGRKEKEGRNKERKKRGRKGNERRKEGERERLREEEKKEGRKKKKERKRGRKEEKKKEKEREEGRGRKGKKEGRQNKGKREGLRGRGRKKKRKQERKEGKRRKKEEKRKKKEKEKGRKGKEGRKEEKGGREGLRGREEGRKEEKERKREEGRKKKRKKKGRETKKEGRKKKKKKEKEKERKGGRKERRERKGRKEGRKEERKRKKQEGIKGKERRKEGRKEKERRKKEKRKEGEKGGRKEECILL
ncbi:MPN domain-containing protein [Crotalus adamanteus]|uniref:MPN domain-containing protein n=1 Tax=Crotalus adamanteus TaxID=8729 RepID=A0AAW1C5N7_CROAD